MDLYLAVLKKYVQFEGRARRSEYWAFTLIHLLILWILLFAVLWLENIAVGIPDKSTLNSVWEIRSNIIFLIFIIYFLATIIPWAAVTCRRLHDSDMSGFWMLAAAISNGSLFLCLLLFRDGTEGPNSYGENPKAAVIPETPEE